MTRSGLRLHGRISTRLIDCETHRYLEERGLLELFGDGSKTGGVSATSALLNAVRVDDRKPAHVLGHKDAA